MLCSGSYSLSRLLFDLNVDQLGKNMSFLARLYESTGRAIAVTTASALQNVNFFG